MSTTTITETRAPVLPVRAVNGSTLEPIKIGTLTCKPLHPTFGAEIEGIDFSKPVPDWQIKEVVEAQNRFGVTVYRNTGLTDETHIAFSRQLGELEKVPKFNGPNVPDRFGHPELFDAGNTNLDGTIVQKNSRRWWYNKGNALWHTDSSFNQYRSKHSLLLSHRIPKEGGNTDFADVRRAYRDLPEERKAKLRGLVVKHDLWHSRQLAAPEEFKNITETEKAAKRPAYHKLIQIAPDGEETLYIAAHAAEIVDMPKEEGPKLIWELIDHCTQPSLFSLTDLVLVQVFWDNRCTMHRATPFSDQMEVRDMRRTTVFDDGPEKNGVLDAGPKLNVCRWWTAIRLVRSLLSYHQSVFKNPTCKYAFHTHFLGSSYPKGRCQSSYLKNAKLETTAISWLLQANRVKQKPDSQCYELQDPQLTSVRLGLQDFGARILG